MPILDSEGLLRTNLEKIKVLAGELQQAAEGVTDSLAAGESPQARRAHCCWRHSLLLCHISMGPLLAQGCTLQLLPPPTTNCHLCSSSVAA